MCLWRYSKNYLIMGNEMYELYLSFGYHNIHDVTAEQFEKLKKFYKLFEAKDGFWQNKRGDIFAWRKDAKI